MAGDVARPNCPCHGVPMVRNGNQTSAKAVGKYRQSWRCRITSRVRNQRDYASLEGEAKQERLLKAYLSSLNRNVRTRERAVIS